MALRACVLLKAKLDLRFKIHDLNYINIQVHIACKDPFSGLQRTSEVRYQLIFEIRDLDDICCHVFLASTCLDFTNEMRRRTR